MSDIDYITALIDLRDATPLAQPDAERRCATCALWLPKYAAMGECLLPWVLESAVQIQVNGNSTGTLLTPGYHNCAGWEAKLPKAFEGETDNA